MVEHDYYQILSVAPNADLDAIKKAFRKKVMECHPDRGGSHAEMVLVNEAWEILSNPELRLRYDEAYRHFSDAAAQQTAAADAREARHRAESYPRSWQEVENWLKCVAGDFTMAEYSQFRLKAFGPMFGEFQFPSAGKSLSGWVFIAVGAVLGLVFFNKVMHDSVEKWLVIGFPVKRARDLVGAMIALIPVLGGAWAGAGLHWWIGDEIKKSQRQSTRHTQCEPQTFAEPGNQNSSATVRDDAQIVACEKCGQKLRVPCKSEELIITCRSCGHKFAWHRTE